VINISSRHAIGSTKPQKGAATVGGHTHTVRATNIFVIKNAEEAELNIKSAIRGYAEIKKINIGRNLKRRKKRDKPHSK